MSSELRSWRDALVILLAASLATLSVQIFYGPFITIPFTLFVIYLPTLAAAILYLMMWWKYRVRSRSESPIQ